MFCRTLADTICAEDMEAMLCRALSFETWSWRGGQEGEGGGLHGQSETPPQSECAWQVLQSKKLITGQVTRAWMPLSPLQCTHFN